MIYDLIIVGAGSAGLSAAIYAGRAMLNTLVIEKSSYGGRIKDTSEIVNYPGFDRISGLGLIQNFREQAVRYGTNNFIFGTVKKISKSDGIFTVSTRRKGDFKAKTVIIALGSKSKVLGIKGETEFRGQGVSYCATCDANFFAGKNIHILGSGNVALEEADYLSKFANKVTMIVLHEKGIVDGSEVQKRRIFKNPKVEFLWDTELEEINGDDGFIQELVVKNRTTQEKKRISSEGIFMFVGLVPETEVLKGLVDLDEEGFVIVDSKQETSLEGLYAAGDCTKTYLRQVVTAASDGAVAAVAAERNIRGRE